jgi:enoyl-CoA hydratase/carnithine racemase
MDVCFAALGKAIFGHPEVAIGLVPGGGATQGLPRLIGRGRAMEVLLGCNDLSAELAERYGYVNRALPADELTPFCRETGSRSRQSGRGCWRSPSESSASRGDTSGSRVGPSSASTLHVQHSSGI